MGSWLGRDLSIQSGDQRLGQPTVACHESRPQFRFLPPVLVRCLGYGDAVFRLEPVLEAPNHGSLGLERVAAREVQHPTDDTDYRHRRRRLGRGQLRQRTGDLLDLIALDDVAYLQVVVAFDPDSTLVAVAHFADIVLEALQTRERSLVDLDLIP